MNSTFRCLKAVSLLRCGSAGRPRTKGGKRGAGSLLRGKTDFSMWTAQGPWGQWELARGAREQLVADRPGEGTGTPHREVCDDCRRSIPRPPCQLVSRPFILSHIKWPGSVLATHLFPGLPGSTDVAQPCTHSHRRKEIWKKATVFSTQTGIVLIVQGQQVLETGHLE